MDKEKLDQIVDSTFLDYLCENPIEYNLGDIVYLKTDTDKKARIITGILFDSNGINYRSVLGTENYWAFSNELTKEKNLVMKTDN